ncbi:MAG: DNA polymerase III subunit beta [Proteobacteria bacterium]|nr:DNA polymerase III subunit beta [Pseudomonadota bacterium]
MKLDISQDLLIDKATGAAAIMPRKAVIPEHELLRLEASAAEQPGMLTIYADSYDMKMKARVPCRVHEPGATLVSAKVFVNIISKLSATDPISLTLKDKKLIIKSGRGRYSVQALEPEGPPLFPKVGEIDTVPIGPFVLDRMIKKVGIACSAEGDAFQMDTILFAFQAKSGGGMFLENVATNGHRMAKSRIALATNNLPSWMKEEDGSPREEKRLFPPVRGLREASRIAERALRETKSEEQPGMVYLGITDNDALMILHEDTALFLAGLNTRYPDYNSIIPASFDKTIIMEASALATAIGRLSVLTDGKWNAIQMTMKEKNCIVTARSQIADNEGKDEIDCEAGDQELTAAFNYRYVLDVLGVMTSQVAIRTGVEARAIVIEEVENPDEDEYIYIVMPIRN